MLVLTVLRVDCCLSSQVLNTAHVYHCSELLALVSEHSLHLLSTEVM